MHIIFWLAAQLGLALFSRAIAGREANKRLAEAQSRLPGVDDIKFPVVTESMPVPVLFGRHWLKGPNVLWYGFFRRRQRADGDVEAGVVRFDGIVYLSYCRGPVDKVLRMTGDGVLLDATQRTMGTSPVSFTLDRYDVWGEPKKGGEGGLNGKYTFYNGDPAQSTPNIFTQDLFDESSGQVVQVKPFVDNNDDPIMPAFRGLFTLLLGDYLSPGDQPSISPNINGDIQVTWGASTIDRFYFGARPMLKPIDLLLDRMLVRGNGAAQWYDQTVNIIGEMNPAHIIHELLTDETLGYPIAAEYMDDDVDDPNSTFANAAFALKEELLGLSFVWGQQSDRMETISEVLRHINGVLVRNPKTGKHELRLFRDDYTINLLPVISKSLVQSVLRYTRPDASTLPTVLDVRYMDREADSERIVKQDDQAGLLVRGEIREEAYYQMAATSAVAARIATQYMMEISTPLAVVELSLPYCVACDLLPGDVFVWAWPDYGIDSMVLRVLSVTRGMIEDGNVRVRCIEDKYAWRETVYSGPPQSAWVDPVTVALDATASQFELPLLLWVAGVREQLPFARIQDFAADGRGVGSLLVYRPNTAHTGFELWSNQTSSLPRLADPNADWAAPVYFDGTLEPTRFTDAGTLPATTTITIQTTGVIPAVGALLALGAGAGKQPQEIMLVTASYEESGDLKIDVERALMDTVELYANVSNPVGVVDPVAIQIGQVIDQFEPFGLVRGYAMDVPRLVGDASNMRALTNTARGQLAYADATNYQVSILGRPSMPIAPYIYDILEASSEITVSWRHRNRLVDRLVFTDESVTAESGVEYELRIYELSPTPALLRTVTALDGTDDGFVYTNAMENSDRGSGLATVLRFEMDAVRSGIESYYTRSKIFTRL